ncbi:hypothetical protein JTB14_015825 [Gonioctena quinquepunctata]|nr:hypothetical protein JTB14_015825 [Gonioctena quinquepunctata]
MAKNEANNLHATPSGGQYQQAPNLSGGVVPKLSSQTLNSTARSGGSRDSSKMSNSNLKKSNQQNIKTQNVQPKSQDTQKIIDRQVSEAIQIAQSTIIAQDKNRNRNIRENHWDKSKYGTIVGSNDNGNIKTIPKKEYVTTCIPHSYRYKIKRSPTHLKEKCSQYYLRL